MLSIYDHCGVNFDTCQNLHEARGTRLPLFDLAQKEKATPANAGVALRTTHQEEFQDLLTRGIFMPHIKRELPP